MKSRPYPGKIPSVWAGKSLKKRGVRILPVSGGYAVHVTSRAVQQRFLFEEAEKEKFTELMEAWADFSGITLLTHCLMNNHFHLFLWVPEPEEVTLEELKRRIRRVWPANKVEQWERFHTHSTAEQKQAMEQALRDRMFDLPAFMRVLKQSFSTWYNRQHDCCGTLWESRYRSMVVKTDQEALMNVATYIDLNPIRAGICRDPAQYRWTAYARAESGDASRQQGLKVLFEKAGLSCATGAQGIGQTYRMWMYRKGVSLADKAGVSSKRRKRRGFSSFEVLREYERFCGAQAGEGEMP